MFRGFYKKKISQRRALIDAFRPNLQKMPISLPETIADNMIENYLMNYEMPLGVAVNFEINKQSYCIPMVVEEPSVIAAASNAAKILGNIDTTYGEREITGQIILSGVENLEETIQILQINKEQLLSRAKEVSENMVKRGGGPLDLIITSKISSIEKYIVIYLTFNPCDAMGANAVNTCLEALAPEIERLTQQKALMKILSNYSQTAVAIATTSISAMELHPELEQGIEIAKRIAMATDYASIDIYRATTHNKGIMNGIDAVCLATGNDWRAVEASAHAYASSTGQYKPLTKWHYEEESKMLRGEIKIPIPVAVVGGTISVHPVAQWALDLLNRPSAETLAQIMAAVGLAQNFAALRAIVTEGIQTGHMALQAKSLAIQVGALEAEIEPLVKLLQASPLISSTVATALLKQLRQEKSKE